jgi:hypothetical protein
MSSLDAIAPEFDTTKECAVLSKWRVIVIRRNGESIALRNYETRKSAEKMQKRLLDSHSFADVRVEADI